MNVTIPIVSIEAISVDKFRSNLSKFMPNSEPIFEIGDVAVRETILKSGSPVLIVGVRSAPTSGLNYSWVYDCVGISERDASYKEFNTINEKELKKIGA